LLLDSLSWKQWHGWERFYQQDPWGEWRHDLRAAINTMEAKGSDAAFNLTWPYIETTHDLEGRADELKARTLTPDLQEKLRKARAQHLKKSDGNQHQ
jgi:hypothetical protein